MHLVSHRVLLTLNPVFIFGQNSVGNGINKAAVSIHARTKKGCQTSGANLGKSNVNTKSRQSDQETEASSDVKDDQMLVKLIEPGS